MMGAISSLVRNSWRDLWRNRRRTLLVGMSMVFSAFIMVFAVGMNAGLVDDMARTVTGSFLGHAQVQSPGYAADPNLEHALSGAQVTALANRFAGMPEVLSFSPRLVTGGLMNKKSPAGMDDEDLSTYRSMTSEGVMLLGIDPVAERSVSTLAESVMVDDPRRRCLRGCEAALAENGMAPDARCLAMCPEGQERFSGDSCRTECGTLCVDRCPADDDWCDEQLCRSRCQDYCEAPRFLADSNPYARPNRGEVVLGHDLARVLRVDVGDRVAMTSGGAEGRSYGAIYRVCGLLKSSQSQLNRTLALTHRQTLSAGVHLDGGATAVVLRFDDFEKAGGTAAVVEQKIHEEASISTLRVRPWGELAPDVETFIRLKLGGTYVMMLVFTLVVAVIIANVVTMSVLERTREYGVRLALGEPSARLIGSVFAESLMLALLCSALGAALGVGVVEHYARAGLDMGMGQMETAGVVLTGILYPRTTLMAIVFAITSVLGFSLIGTLYPALRIRRIRVMDALHFS